MSPGEEIDFSKLYLTRNSITDYENLCKLDVLGLEDVQEVDDPVYDRFQKQLTRSSEGWYETGLLWKQEVNTLENNKAGSLGRLQKLIEKLEKNPELFNKYDQIIQDQIADAIVEKAPESSERTEFYLPHRSVIRENAESTKIRIVYDGSAKAIESTNSLNECLETGPPLQNLIWDIVIRNRLNPIAFTGNMKQAFLQIRIRQEDRDCLRFHWIVDKKLSNIVVLRFTRAIFGLVQSPF